ncbi:polycystin-1-like protein 1 [Tubulanus polymorphus]|uniref:polycystin-1-like protein 1 n=1 Tax=Tubulanus polymorphus TaxID=672921 RepID=UPI003DA27B56
MKPVAIFLLFYGLSCVACGEWNVGCYRFELTKYNISSMIGGNAGINVDSCARNCRLKKYKYAGILNSKSCYCANSLHDNYIVETSKCSKRCIKTLSLVDLPCGDAGYISIYTTRGPFILTGEISVEDHILISRRTSIEVIVKMAALMNYTNSGVRNMTADDLKVKVVVEVSGSVYQETIVVNEGTDDGRTLIHHTFNNEGIKSINLNVENAISTFYTSTQISVHLPAPHDLQVNLIRPSSVELPSCILLKYYPIPKDSVTVFINQSVSFEASVAVGTNLTFRWRFPDATAENSSVVSDSKIPNDTCAGRTCLTDAQDHRFTVEGMFNIFVTVANDFGTINKTIHVIVLTHRISNLTLGTKLGKDYSVRIHDNVAFVISMTTTSRLHSIMNISFGDGNTKMYVLKERQTASDSVPAVSGAIHLVASYEHGCKLSVEITHAYSVQSPFRPEVRAYNDDYLKRGGGLVARKFEYANLTRPILVLKDLVGANLSMPHAVRTRTNIRLSVRLSMAAMQTTFDWSIRKLDASQIKGEISIANFTTKSPILNYEFTNAGTYVVAVTARNSISVTRTEARTIAQDPVAGLVVTKSRFSQFLPVGTRVRCRARVSSGTDAVFAWDFNDATNPTFSARRESDFESAANHTFDSVGVYNVTVRASNYVSSKQTGLTVRIEEPITGLIVTSDSPRSRGAVVRIRARVVTGSNVVWDADFDGTGRQRIGAGRKDVSVERVFDSPGLHQVTVYADNKVSVPFKRIEVVIQDTIPYINITTLQNAVTGKPTVLVALISGSLIKRTDVLYRWTIENVTVMSTQPILKRIFQLPGKIDYELIVENQVSSRSVQGQIDVVSTTTDSLRLLHNVTYMYGTNTNFTLVGLPLIRCSVKISYGNEKKAVLSTDGRSTFSWTYTYTWSSLYEIQMAVTPSGGVEQQLSSVLVVQAPISSLNINGPSVVALQRVLTNQKWLCSVGSGTDIVYRWQVDSSTIFTAENYIFYNFSHSGEFDVKVTAINVFGNITTSKRVTVQHPIISVNITVALVIQGEASRIEIDIEGGDSFEIIIDFGDGKNRTIQTTRRADAGAGAADAGAADAGTADAGAADVAADAGAADGLLQTIRGTSIYHMPPKFKVIAEHRYATEGDYVIRATVVNEVSNRSATATAKVEQRISGVVVSSDSKRIVETGEVVVVKVTVEKGNDLKFSWNFRSVGSPQVLTSGRTSTASFMFLDPGTFNVSVSITNAAYKQPVVAWLPDVFVVAEPVLNVAVGLHRLNPRTAAALSVSGYTHEITFTAVAASGSGMTFEFNFGDGTTKNKSAIYHEMRGSYYANIKHVYNRVGVYTVSVKASNILGSARATMRSSFYVQVAPSGLRFVNSRYANAVGEVTRLRVELEAGTDVQIDWLLGDENELTNASKSVTHQYINPGMYVVQVTAYNKVDTIYKLIKVFIQKPLQGCYLKAMKMIARTKEQVTFIATPAPDDPKNVVYYEFDFGVGNSQQSLSNQTAYSYKRKGVKIVKVTAFNYISNATSAPIEVKVIEPIDVLKIEMDGSVLVNSMVSLKSYIYSGSDVTYTWDLGDGSPQIVTTEDHINHTYTRVGEYLIILTAVNLVSNMSVSSVVFILNRPCKPPDVRILGDRGMKIFRSSAIKLEASISPNCSITPITHYQWTLKNGTTGDRIEFPLLSPSIFRQRILFLPRLSLMYGNVSAELQVDMNDTIVYSRSQTYFFIEPTPLQAIIRGGVQRTVAADDDVVLDAAESFDPDFPDARDISYQWRCAELATVNESCFIEPLSTMNFQHDGSPDDLLRIAGKFFAKDEVVLSVNISRPGRGFGFTSQVLVISRLPNTLDVIVNCPGCESGFVNSNRRLVLESTCQDCDHHDDGYHFVTYEWQLFIVAERNDFITAAGAHNQYSCIEANGSSYIKFLKAAHEKLMNTTTTTATTTTTVSTTTTTETTQNPSAGASGADDSFKMSEGSSASRGRRGRRRRKRELVEAAGSQSSSNNRFAGTPQEGASSSSRRGGTSGDEGQGPTEGRGNGRGNGSGQGGAGGSGGGGTTTGGGTDGGGGDNVIDGSLLPPKIDSHIVTKPRYRIYLDPARDTTTGMNQRWLVVKPGVLQQSRTYFAQVLVRHEGNVLRTGEALTVFRVNESPTRGDCSIRPQKGIEMDTMFKIYCKEWKDKDLPITYEVGYSFEEGTRAEIVYRGLNREILFKLPAGYERNHHKVFVHISILDSLGDRTNVCYLAIEVQPNQFATARHSMEQVLYEQTVGERSELSNSANSGDNVRARLQILQVSNVLNRVQTTSTEQAAVATRAQIRCSMLEKLRAMSSPATLREEVDLLQTCSALIWVTNIADELLDASVQYATDILTQFTVATVKLASNLGRLDNDLLTIAVKSASNLVTASIEKASEISKTAITESTNTIDTLLKTKLQFHTIGEEPVQRIAPEVAVKAVRFSDIDKQTYSIGASGAYFNLPGSIQSVLSDLQQQPSSRLRRAAIQFQRDENCYQGHMMTFKRNPYFYNQRQTDTIQTLVASLNLYDCRGDRLNITDLSTDQRIAIHLPRIRSRNESYVVHRLRKERMNLHRFNITAGNLRETLFVEVTLKRPARVGRLFPIELIINYESILNTTSFIQKKVFGKDETKLKLHLDQGNFTEPGQYVLGILDADYNKGRSRSNQIREREYTLSVWWGSCLYWDERGDEWRADGCAISSTSTRDAINCSCAHLTSFGGHFKLVPNDLDFKNVDDFFDVSKNPVTVALVAAILVVYVICVTICHRLDELEKQRNKEPLYLLDNSHTDRQCYHIAIETGFRQGAGTSAKVSVVLHGDEGVSETRELIGDDVQPTFERNSRHTFVMMLPDSIGTVHRVQIWHNNQGNDPSWYISRIIVRDCNTGVNYYFSCEKWLAVQEDDGKVEREFNRLEGGLGFKKVLWIKSFQYITDYHIWGSLLTRPTYSRFLRTERITCCLALLMSYLCLNALWYKDRSIEYRGEFGLLDVSWPAVVTGFIVTVTVLPVNFLIAFMFRRSRVRKISEKNDEYKTVNKDEDDEDSMNQYSAVQPVMTHSLLDQSMINWQTLQEWAQKQWAKKYGSSESAASSSSTTADVKLTEKTDVKDVTSSGFGDCLSQDRLLGRIVTAGDENFGSIITQTTTESGVVVDAPPPIGEEENDAAKTREPPIGEETSSEGSPAENSPMIPAKPIGVVKPLGHTGIPPSAGISPSAKSPPFLSVGSRRLNPDWTPPTLPLTTDPLFDQSTVVYPESEIQKPADDTIPPAPPTPPQAVVAPQPPILTPLPPELPFQQTAPLPPMAHRYSASTGSWYPVVSRSHSNSGRSSQSVRSDSSKFISNYDRDYRYLPYWCRYVAWAMCFLVIVGCGAVTVLFGFAFGPTKSLMWLQSLFFSLMVCIFITHPVLIIITSVITAIRNRDNLHVLDCHSDEYYKSLEASNRKPKLSRLANYESDFERGIAARQRSRYLRFARPPEEKHLTDSRKKILKQKRALNMFWDAVSIIGTLILLLVIANGSNNTAAYRLNEAVRAEFIATETMPFTSIRRINDWWTWSRTDLINALYWDSWYNGDNNTVEGTVLMGTGHIIGEVHIRQLRVVEEPCAHAAVYRQLLPGNCYYRYTTKRVETDEYGPDDAWTFQGRHLLRRQTIDGHFGRYDNSGYDVILNASRVETVEQLRYLHDNDWIDRQTRAVVVEFTIYNPSQNLFTSISLTAEMPPTGGIEHYVRIESARLYKYVSKFDNFVLACELLFIAVTLYLIHDFVYRTLERQQTATSSFRSFWTWTEVSFLIVAVGYILCFICRFVVVHDAIEHMRATFYEHYVDMSFPALWDLILRTLVGLLILLLCVQFLKLLQYKKLFVRFFTIYRKARTEILLFAVSFALVLMTFTSLGFLLFNSASWYFSSFWLGCVSLSGLLVRSYPFNDGIANYSHQGARVFVVTFLIFGLGLLTGYIVAVLTYYLKTSCKEEPPSMSALETLRFYWTTLLDRVGLKPIDENDDSDEEDTTLPPEFTMAEIEYQVDELLFKMTAITGTHGLPEKPECEFTDSDCTYGPGDDMLSNGSSENPVFDDSRFENRIHKIEDNIYHGEPTLARIIHLDNIGANVMSLETEDQLRNKLEFEIYRQLRVKRMLSPRKPVSCHSSSTQTDDTLTTPPESPDQQTKIIFPRQPPQVGVLLTSSTEDESGASFIPGKPEKLAYIPPDVNPPPAVDCELIARALKQAERQSDFNAAATWHYFESRIPSRFYYDDDDDGANDTKSLRQTASSVVCAGDGQTDKTSDTPIQPRLRRTQTIGPGSSEEIFSTDALNLDTTSSDSEVGAPSAAEAGASSKTARKSKKSGGGKTGRSGGTGRSWHGGFNAIDDFFLRNAGFSSDSDIDELPSSRPSHKQAWS